MTNILIGRIALTLIFSFLFFAAFTQPTKTFSSLKYDKVIIYDYSGSKDYYIHIIDEQGQLAKTVTKQVTLNTMEINKLSKSLDSKSSYGSGSAACFDPHLGIVYYHKTKIVAHVSVCLDCNALDSSIDIAAQKQGKIGKGKDAYYMLGGMSKSFRYFLNTLLIKYKFSHQIVPGESFDQ
ncbi:hypothetical protein [Mucilaginibacter sp. NFX135]|uniref:hypothetical protein n=1 Tax=Mucilaginibacter sp. NFX135 TaxID=3402687 RepID=UPI003AFAD2E2